MLGTPPFYFGTLRTMVIAFGHIFKDTYITRTSANGDVSQLVKVPLIYGPKDKRYVSDDMDPEFQRLTAITLPRMTFEFVNMVYDNRRKLNTSGRNVRKSDNPNKLKRQYNPVPYDFNFNLYVYTKFVEDGTKIVEQITPRFTPDWTMTIDLIPEMNEKKDIPVILNSVSYQDNYAGDELERRYIIWTLSFTMKGWMYGPIVDKPIIKVVNTEFYVQPGNGHVGTITTTPGLLANGSPTSNASLSVNTSIIEVDDDFGFCHTVTGDVMLS